MDSLDQITQNSQPSAPLPRRSPDLVGAKAGSFLTNKLFLVLLAILVLSTFIYASANLGLNSKSNQQPAPSKTIPTSAPTPTPDPTANWKTYINQKLKYSFKYPASISFGPVSITEYSSGNLRLEYFTKGTLSSPHTFVISPVDNQKNLSVKEYIDNILSAKDTVLEDGKRVSIAERPEAFNIKRQPITISGTAGEKVEGLPGAYSNVLIVASDQDKLFEISASPYDEQESEWVEIVDQILSTFKFTQ